MYQSGSVIILVKLIGSGMIVLFPLRSVVSTSARICFGTMFEHVQSADTGLTLRFDA
jgi:hypothetical protein